MDQNNIIAAPRVGDQLDVLYEQWSLDHVGTWEDFYTYLTTPSADRSLFLAGQRMDLQTVAGIVQPIYRPL